MLDYRFPRIDDRVRHTNQESWSTKSSVSEMKIEDIRFVSDVAAHEPEHLFC